MRKIKSKNKISIIRLVFLLSLILMSGFILLGYNSISPKRYYVETNSVKSSNSEILIITPENKTYTEPMSGYYPGTYGFENDEIGSNPAGWVTVEENSTIQVISELDNHKNIVEIDDTSSAAVWPGIFQYSRFPKSYGTIEFWVRMNSTSESLQISARDSIDNEVVLNLKAELGKWIYRASTIDYNVPNVNDPQPYTWHHVRIDFRCHNAPAYLGISNDRCIVTIDGISSGELQHAKLGKLDYQWFRIGTAPTAIMKVWVDAVGFAEDPNYNIGDNLDEGLLLSFDNSTNLDWIGYSLDGQANKTILGNTTISMQADGSYNIQVLGNNSLGTMYQSNLRHFTIDTIPPEISIIFPTTVQVFSNAPAFSLSITEENIASTWYTLNGGSTIPFTGESGTIDSTAWNALADGNVTIRFYVQDMANRLDFDEVEVIKESPEIPSEIPGYHLILVIGVSCVVIGLIAKKKLKF